MKIPVIWSGLKPLPQFLVLGALLFGVKQLTADGRVLGIGAEPIVVTAGQVEQLQAQWLAETRRLPTRLELEASVRRHADEETLLREALRLGLDRSDPVVRSRLVQNLRFARGDPQADEGAVFAEALALGMALRDVVARRRLVQAMEGRLAGGARVSDAEVRDYIAANPQRYASRPRVSFEQVFTPRQGQSSALLPGVRVVAQTQADLARSFGLNFARSVMAAPVGQWTGPIPSAYGEHRVRVTERPAAQPADVDAIYRQARFALLDEAGRAVVRAALADLRRAYPLELEP